MHTPDPQEALANAIHNHADTFDNDQPAFLDSFAVIACWAPTTSDGGYRYSLHYHAPSVPDHVALGLFDLAVQMVSSGEVEDGGDDD
jgi:hypothetical protein